MALPYSIIPMISARSLEKKVANELIQFLRDSPRFISLHFLISMCSSTEKSVEKRIFIRNPRVCNEKLDTEINEKWKTGTINIRTTLESIIDEMDTANMKGSYIKKIDSSLNLECPMIPTNFYTILTEIIGSGAFGIAFTGKWMGNQVVFKCVYNNDRIYSIIREVYVLRKLSESFIDNEYYRNNGFVNSIFKTSTAGIQLYNKLMGNNPFILKFYGVFVAPFESSELSKLVKHIDTKVSKLKKPLNQDLKFDINNDIYVIIIEYAGKDMKNMGSDKKNITISNVMKYAFQIAYSLMILHEDHKVIHSDIKPENIAYKEDNKKYFFDLTINRSHFIYGIPNDNNVSVKLIDYGIVRSLSSISNKWKQEGNYYQRILPLTAGTPIWRLPYYLLLLTPKSLEDILDTEENSLSNNDPINLMKKMDIFSYGMTLVQFFLMSFQSGDKTIETLFGSRVDEMASLLKVEIGFLNILVNPDKNIIINHLRGYIITGGIIGMLFDEQPLWYLPKEGTSFHKKFQWKKKGSGFTYWVLMRSKKELITQEQKESERSEFVEDFRTHIGGYIDFIRECLFFGNGSKINTFKDVLSYSGFKNFIIKNIPDNSIVYQYIEE